MQFRVESGVGKPCMVFKTEVDFFKIHLPFYVWYILTWFSFHSVSVVVLSGIGLEYQGSFMNQDLTRTDAHV
jgi:hypothetical protein